eukprot:s1249_g14.t2
MHCDRKAGFKTAHQPIRSADRLIGRSEPERGASTVFLTGRDEGHQPLPARQRLSGDGTETRMYSDDLRDAPADEVPVEWVFEAHDDADEEVLSPPASGASKSWLSWLQGTPAPKGHQYSRESDASAGSLPQESEPSREPPDLTPSAPASAAKPSGYTGILGWMTGQAFADEPDAPLPAPLPSRLDPEDEESVRHSSPSAPARSVVEIDIPGGMFSEDEVIGERNVHRAASTATNAPPAPSSAARRRAAPRRGEGAGRAALLRPAEHDTPGGTLGDWQRSLNHHLGQEPAEHSLRWKPLCDISRPQKLPDRQVSFDMDGIPGPDSERPRKHTDPDDFIARFNHADAAEAVAAVTASDDLVPPPLPPPNEPPAPEEEQGFYEIHEASPEAVLIANVGQAVMEEQPKEVDREVEGRGPSKQDAHPATIPEEPQADVAVVVDPDTEPEDDSPEGQQPQRRRCLACCCNKAPRKKQKPKAVEDTASEDYRHQQSKLLDEEIEDFSGTPFVTFVAWITHRGLARAPMCCVCSGMLLVIAIIAGGMVARPPNVDVDWGAFLKTDVNTSTMRDVFLFALQHRQTERRLTEETELVEDRRLQGNRLYKHSDIFLAYDFPDDANAGPNGWLDSGHLYSVMSLERRLRSTAMWQQLCNRSDDVELTSSRSSADAMAVSEHVAVSPASADRSHWWANGTSWPSLLSIHWQSHNLGTYSPVPVLSRGAIVSLALASVVFLAFAFRFVSAGVDFMKGQAKDEGCARTQVFHIFFAGSSCLLAGARLGVLGDHLDPALGLSLGRAGACLPLALALGRAAGASLREVAPVAVLLAVSWLQLGFSAVSSQQAMHLGLFCSGSLCALVAVQSLAATLEGSWRAEYVKDRLSLVMSLVQTLTMVQLLAWLFTLAFPISESESGRKTHSFSGFALDSFLDGLVFCGTGHLLLKKQAILLSLCQQCAPVDDKPLCEQGISLVNYVFPSPMVLGPDVVPSMLVYDAGGREKVAPQVAVALMEEHNVKDIIVDADYEDGQPLRRIRSCFRFKWYCCTSLMSSSEQGVVLEEMRQTWDTFLNEAVMPILKEFREAQAQRAAEGSGTKPFEMYYTGSTLYSKEDAAKSGHMPFGAVLADAEGKILAEAHNQSVVAAKRGGSGDVTRHAETM